MPFFGTTILLVYPVHKRFFEDLHGINPNDLAKLVDFAKSEGRIQFALGGKATKYEQLDFLDPIFDLKPPLFSVLSPLQIVNEKTYNNYGIEFDTIANLGYKQYFNLKYDRVKTEFAYELNKKAEYQNDVCSYAFAKCLGYEELTDLITENMLLEDYESVNKLVGIAEHFIYREILSPFNRIHTYNRPFLSSLSEGIRKPNSNQGGYETTKEIPFEIGRFLIMNKKLTNASGDFEACKELCANYRESDLHKLLINLQNGLKDSNIDILTSTKNELDVELENLWNNAASIRKRMNLLETLIPLSLGIVGELAGKIENNDGYGVLSYFGFKAFDRILGVRKEKISEKIGKWRKKDYLIGVFDFQQKIPDSLKEN